MYRRLHKTVMPSRIPSPPVCCCNLESASSCARLGSRFVLYAHLWAPAPGLPCDSHSGSTGLRSLSSDRHVLVKPPEVYRGERCDGRWAACGDPSPRPLCWRILASGVGSAIPIGHGHATGHRSGLHTGQDLERASPPSMSHAVVCLSCEQTHLSCSLSTP